MSVLRVFTVVRRSTSLRWLSSMECAVAEQIMRGTGARVVREPPARCAVGSSRRQAGERQERYFLFPAKGFQVPTEYTT